MRTLVRLSLLTAAFALCLTATAAGHPPTQHQQQRLSWESAVTGFDSAAQLREGTSISAKCENGMAGPYPCENVDLLGFTPLPMLGGASGNDIWGWTDSETGREYAIMGTSNSTGFVDVTDPENPVLKGTLFMEGIPDAPLWRDVKVDGNYAFIVSENSESGMQVFDLTKLREESPVPQAYEADANYFGSDEQPVSNSHNVSINEETDYAYLVGTNTCGTEDSAAGQGENGGLHMVDISDPLNPTFAGCALLDTFADDENNNYAHDVECVIYRGPDPDYQGREICVGSNENVVAVYDVTDKSNPVVVSDTGYDTASYTHSGSLTEDQRYFLMGDELDEQERGLPTTTYILDMTDLDNPSTPLSYEHETSAIDHNMYVHGNRVFQSNYMAGLRILEFDNASLDAGQLTPVAYFDMVPGDDVAEFAGTWSNYQFPSGTIVASAIENAVNGLFVLKANLGDDTAGGPDTGNGTNPAKKKSTKKAKKCKRKRGPARAKGKPKTKRKCRKGKRKKKR